MNVYFKVELPIEMKSYFESNKLINCWVLLIKLRTEINISADEIHPDRADMVFLRFRNINMKYH